MKKSSNNRAAQRANPQLTAWGRRPAVLPLIPSNDSPHIPHPIASLHPFKTYPKYYILSGEMRYLP
ncbi:MAG TPA: hypothetical protein VMT57_04040 [Candidatus Thermoplasmatota archaeon]|nr:hypothetical protein [Candidatus Thermoplasmatota archaeon]